MGRSLNWFFLAASCVPSPLLAQSLIDSAAAARFEARFLAQSNPPKLSCDVRSLSPSLSFGFRFQTGYVFHIPMKQYTGAGHRWRILTKVMPESGGGPVYLVSSLRLPGVIQKKQTIEWGGFYWVGEGRYRVDWTLVDDLSRVCSGHWNIEAKPTAPERGLSVGIAPGSVQPVSFRRWDRNNTNVPDLPSLNRLTVLLHAGPLFPRRTRFRPEDQLILLGTLSSLLESVPARSVRLVVFNLDQQKELYRSDAFSPDEFDEAVESMDNLQLQLVDYRVLANRRGHVNLLSDLFQNEVAAPEPSDAVIVLGPPARFDDKVPASIAEGQAAPPLFYIECRPYFGPDFPDSIDFAVRRLHGRKLVVHTPDEYAKAIRQIGGQLSIQHQAAAR
jgi:hypothetical protein